MDGQKTALGGWSGFLTDAGQIAAPNKVECKNCLYWVKLPQLEHHGGECHVMPPAIAMGIDNLYGGVWPMVQGDKWCGHFVWNDLLLRSKYPDAIASFRAAWAGEELNNEEPPISLDPADGRMPL